METHELKKELEKRLATLSMLLVLSGLITPAYFSFIKEQNWGIQAKLIGSFLLFCVFVTSLVLREKTKFRLMNLNLSVDASNSKINTNLNVRVNSLVNDNKAS